MNEALKNIDVFKIDHILEKIKNFNPSVKDV